MKTKFLRSTLASLTLIFLTSSARAQAIPINLLPEQVHNISQELVRGKVCQANLPVVQAAYNDCAAKKAAPTILTPGVVIGGMVVSFGFGALFVATKCFGLCK